MSEKFPSSEENPESDFAQEKSVKKVVWLGDSVMTNFVLMLTISAIKSDMKAFLGVSENLVESDFQFVRKLPKGVVIPENEVAFTFRLLRGEHSKFCVATFNKNAVGGFDLDTFKGVTFYPDEE